MAIQQYFYSCVLFVLTCFQIMLLGVVNIMSLLFCLFVKEERVLRRDNCYWNMHWNLMHKIILFYKYINYCKFSMCRFILLNYSRRRINSQILIITCSSEIWNNNTTYKIITTHNNNSTYKINTTYYNNNTYKFSLSKLYQNTIWKIVIDTLYNQYFDEASRRSPSHYTFTEGVKKYKGVVASRDALISIIRLPKINKWMNEIKRKLFFLELLLTPPWN